ncbi:alpha-L-fucosidase [Halosquirtibacter xylanolyticus]|uniref:alpha-L-fucosidase n=1 Tax=Halosquirtibacter xylanolyticus TaxID=3374599 RepID=UPI00374896B1|nr:alpha-L-fucosidase [Prolixibacteraceae bacterium]
MQKIITVLSIYIVLLFAISCKSVSPPRPLMPIPTDEQLKWHESERNAFIHFGLNTFNDMEWGYGDTPSTTFNPIKLDAEQWAKTIKAAGLKGVVLTCKHHDGFCLWPSRYTEYSVKNSPWRNGNGDLVKEVSDACKKYGLTFGVYLSPWDRNSSEYGTPEYIEYFRRQLTELLTNYGEISEVWFDGANGGTGWYGGANEKRSVDRRTYYDWPTTIRDVIRKNQPHALVFSDAGPDIRWCGNEKGIAGTTNWSMITAKDYYPGCAKQKDLNRGEEDGSDWVPAEINTSVRPGWFYHKSEDHKVKGLTQLIDYYYESVGRNGTGLLNFPVNRNGLIDPIDSINVVKWQQHLDQDFANNLIKDAKVTSSNIRGGASRYDVTHVIDDNKDSYWATDDSVIKSHIEICFREEISFNRFLVQEYIALGQRVKSFKLEYEKNGKWIPIANETTIGYKRILRFKTVRATKVRFSITDSRACPTISNIALYKAPKILVEPMISRNKLGEVKVEAFDLEIDVLYSIDGSTFKKYTNPFLFDQKGCVEAYVFDRDSGKKSDTSSIYFDICKTKWKMLEPIQSAKSNLMFDGNQQTRFIRKVNKFPYKMTFDLGEQCAIKGFRYLPDQSRRAKGIIFDYSFDISKDGESWKRVLHGEFSNIKNSPIWQTKIFKEQTARYVRLVAESNVAEDTFVGVSEFDIITK